MLNLSDLANILTNGNNETDKAKREVRYGYDPKGNRHCFQKGFAPAWWDGKKEAVQHEMMSDLDLLQGADVDFDVIRGLSVTQLDDGSIIVPDLRTYNIMRADKPKVVLQSDVSSTYNLMPYRKIVLIPDEVTMKLSDFSDTSGVRKFFIEKYGDDAETEVQINKMLTPAGCSGWQSGRQVTFQYKIGECEPRPGDKHNVFLNVESAFDGKKTTRFYLTIVRVVCENTQYHAEQDGWAKLLSYQKSAQRIRRTGLMDERIVGWRDNIGEAMLGAVGIESIFTGLAEKEFASRATRRDKVVEVVNEIFGLKDGKTARGDTRLTNRREAILTVMFDDKVGGDQCKTFFDLWNGITAWNQHFTQVNGLDTLAQAEERRYYNIQTNKVAQEEMNQQFVTMLRLASAA